VAKLVYAPITSLDGYTTDAEGGFEWAAPDDEMFEAVNELERGFGTCLYGRRMYETLLSWESFEASEGTAPAVAAFAEIWRAADKVVYSRTLGAVSSAKTRLERAFDADTVRQMKATVDHDIAIGGPELAGQALAAGLVDEVHLFVHAVTVGGGTPAWPANVRSDLELLGQQRFGSGALHLHYRVEH